MSEFVDNVLAKLDNKNNLVVRELHTSLEDVRSYFDGAGKFADELETALDHVQGDMVGHDRQEGLLIIRINR